MAKLSPKDYDREGCSRLGSISNSVIADGEETSPCLTLNRGVEYRYAKGSISSLNYHFVFCPKRRKAVLIDDVAKRLQEIIFEVVSEHGWKLIALEICCDHVHLFLNAPTHESPSQIIKWVKGRASRYLRQEFPQLKKLPCLWSPSYFVGSTGQVSTDVVKRYIESQRSA